MRAVRSIAWIALVGVVACATTNGAEAPPPVVEEVAKTGVEDPLVAPPPSSLLARPIEDAAELLADPATAEEGVWVLLAGLGLGVYTGDGRQLLAGSETGPEDLWLLEGAVPGLARMADGAPGRFTTLHETLVATGLEVEAEELQAVYLAAMDANHDLPMTRALRALEVSLDVDVDTIELSPLSTWLLLLALLPPNPSGPTPAASGPSLRLPLAAAGPSVTDGTPGLVTVASADDCAEISGSGGPSGWSYAGDAASEAWSAGSGATLDELVPRLGGRARPVMTALQRFIARFATALDALLIALALDSISTDLVMDAAEVRRLRDREPDGSQAVTLSTTVTSRRVPPVRCGPLAGTELPGGPLEGARVSFQLDGFLAQHGHVRYPGGAIWQLADATGRSQVRYETIRDDPPDAYRRSPQQRGTGTVTASFDSLLNAMGESFSMFASVELIAGAFGAFDRTVDIVVTWHEDAHARARDVVQTALGDMIQVDLVACEDPRGSWQGTVHYMDYFDIPWTAEVSFSFPEGSSVTTVTWATDQGPAVLDDGERLYEPDFQFQWEYQVAYDDQVDPPRLRFDGESRGVIVGLGASSFDASFEVPVHLVEDPRCGS